MSQIVKAGSGRLWTIRFRAAPNHTPYFHERAKVTAPDWGQGDITKIETPSPTRYNEWIQADQFQSSPERPSVSVEARLTTSRSELNDLVRLRCAFDAQLHMGMCNNPMDFDHGWEMIYVYPNGFATNYGTTDQGALEGGEQAATNETVDVSPDEIFIILKMYFKEVAKDLVSEEIIAVSVGDTVTCGECEGEASDGCSKVFALSNPAASSPGVKPQVIATDDGYATSHERWLTTFAIGEDASDGTCVGIYFVATSQAGLALHYAEIADILTSSETWTKVITGFVAAKGPNAIWSYSPLSTWIVGQAGYIYFTDDISAGVTVQDAGVATVQNLLDVDGFNSKVVIAGGESNAFVYTTDGVVWQSVTGPEPAANLQAVALRTEDEWWVGTNTGKLYYTVDQGQHWTEVTGLKSTPTEITKIKWANATVGFVATKHAGPAGRIQRTISAGHSWYILPESGSVPIPANDYINDIDVCDKEVNVLYAGGLADDAGDGILIKGADQ